jgi:DNA-directed RNA polymerase subunit RPC12/RpoP
MAWSVEEDEEMNANERQSYYCVVCGKVLTADEQRHTAPRCALCEADVADEIFPPLGEPGRRPGGAL